MLKLAFLIDKNLACVFGRWLKAYDIQCHIDDVDEKCTFCIISVYDPTPEEYKKIYDYIKVHRKIGDLV